MSRDGIVAIRVAFRRRSGLAELSLLLLDEPTNYLDLEGTLWPTDHLARYTCTAQATALSKTRAEAAGALARAGEDWLTASAAYEDAMA